MQALQRRNPKSLLLDKIDSEWLKLSQKTTFQYKNCQIKLLGILHYHPTSLKHQLQIQSHFEPTQLGVWYTENQIEKSREIFNKTNFIKRKEKHLSKETKSQERIKKEISAQEATQLMKILNQQKQGEMSSIDQWMSKLTGFPAFCDIFLYLQSLDNQVFSLKSQNDSLSEDFEEQKKKTFGNWMDKQLEPIFINQMQKQNLLFPIGQRSFLHQHPFMSSKRTTRNEELLMMVLNKRSQILTIEETQKQLKSMATWQRWHYRQNVKLPIYEAKQRLKSIVESCEKEERLLLLVPRLFLFGLEEEIKSLGFKTS